MSEILLQTKLFKPVLRHSNVPHTRLIERSNRGLGAKLTFSYAPTGFGKTTLIADWLLQLQRPFGWLSLDEEENDPYRFSPMLLPPYSRSLGDVETIRPAPNLSIKAIATLLLNSLMQLLGPILLFC